MHESATDAFDEYVPRPTKNTTTATAIPAHISGGIVRAHAGITNGGGAPGPYGTGPGACMPGAIGGGTGIGGTSR